MWFDSPLAGLSVWITYCVQVGFGCLTTLCISAFVQNPRTRVRMWGGFLFLATATWLLLVAPTPGGRSVPVAFRSAPLPAASNLHVALPVTSAWAAYVAKFTPSAWVAYIFILLAVLLRLLFKSLQLRAVVRRSQPPSPSLQLLFERLCLELGVRRSELGLVSELRSPATCHWPRSHVLLPTELVPQLDSDQLADVLRHELIHVRQHDYLWDRLAAISCRLIFFHPLMWLAYRRLRWERELACDRRVVESRADARLPYAECLTRLARWFVEASRVSEGIGFSSSESLLATRVRALLAEPAAYSAFQRAARIALVATMTTAALFLVPSLGLSFYSPVPLATLFTRSLNLQIHSTGRRPLKSKPPAPALAMGGKPLQSEIPPPITFLLDSQSTSLPVLATAATSTAEEDSSYSRRSEDGARPHASSGAWDEAPMPLASPPKWRRLAVGAITGGIALATGRVDVDDVDGPRKRER